MCASALAVLLGVFPVERMLLPGAQWLSPILLFGGMCAIAAAPSEPRDQRAAKIVVRSNKTPAASAQGSSPKPASPVKVVLRRAA